MSLNIPPASVTPAQAAKRLRVLIKQWTQQNPKKKIIPSEAVIAQMDQRNSRINTNLDELFEELNSIRAVGKLRKPSLIDAEVGKAQETLNQLRVRYTSHFALDRQRMVSLLSKQQVDEPLEGLEEAYALVQVLPLLEASPGGKGKAENTLRAVTAILKAHHGLLEQGPEELPTPEMPIVLLREVVKAVEAQQEEEVAVAVPVDPLPFDEEEEDEEPEDDGS